MKILKFIALVATLSMNHAFADGQYACIPGESAGLNWEKNSWNVTRYKSVNSLISVKEGGRKMEYKEAGDDLPTILSCTNGPAYIKPQFINCDNGFGMQIVFSEANMKGGVSAIIGAVTGNANYKDSLSVKTITCQKF